MRTLADRNLLFDQHVKLPEAVLGSIGQRYFPLIEGVGGRDDALQVMRIALWKATERWDPQKGSCFRTYAWGAMFRALQDEGRITSRIEHGWNRRLKQQRAEVVSLWKPVPGAGEVQIADTIEDPHVDLEMTALLREVQDAIAQLPIHLRNAIALRYEEDLTLADVGRCLGVSESRAVQLLNEARDLLVGLLGDLELQAT